MSAHDRVDLVFALVYRVWNVLLQDVFYRVSLVKGGVWQRCAATGFSPAPRWLCRVFLLPNNVEGSSSSILVF